MKISTEILKIAEDAAWLCGKWDGVRLRVRRPEYASRGITMCKEWQGRLGRTRFIIWALQAGFQVGLDLDRIDNDKGYFPENCRWATRSQNLRNTRKSVFVEYEGKKINLKTLSEHPDCKIPYGNLKARLATGWPLKEAMTIPVHPGGGPWADKHGIKRGPRNAAVLKEDYRGRRL